MHHVARTRVYLRMLGKTCSSVVITVEYIQPYVKIQTFVGHGSCDEIGPASSGLGGKIGVESRKLFLVLRENDSGLLGVFGQVRLPRTSESARADLSHNQFTFVAGWIDSFVFPLCLGLDI